MTLPEQQQPDQDALRRRRRRSVALALTLAGLSLIFYVLTIVKMGPAIFDRTL